MVCAAVIETTSVGDGEADPRSKTAIRRRKTYALPGVDANNATPVTRTPHAFRPPSREHTLPIALSDKRDLCPARTALSRKSGCGPTLRCQCGSIGSHPALGAARAETSATITEMLSGEPLLSARSIRVRAQSSRDGVSSTAAIS